MSEQLIQLTKDLIYHATHFDVPYANDAYADKLFIVNVDENGGVTTMDKEQLMGFIRQNKDTGVEPFSTKTEFHYAVQDGNMAMVVITRELELNGQLSRRFLTLIWEYLSGRWQVVKESSIARKK